MECIVFDDAINEYIIHKTVMLKSRIIDVATGYNENIIAIAEFERKIYIWDLRSHKMISNFCSIFQSGGRRLAISGEGNYCAAGAYHIHGIAIYKTTNGELIWQRKDLKKVQELKFSRHRKALLAFFDKQPCYILNIKSGDTITTLRGLRGINESYFDKIQLLDRGRVLDIFDFDKQKSIAKLPRMTFAILDSVFTEESIIISESGGPVSAYSLNNGNLKWRYVPKEGNHILKLGYCEENKEVLGVNWPYEKGGDKILLYFNKNSGKITRQFLIKDCPVETAFALKGSRLVTSNGDLIDTTERKIILRLNFLTN